MTSQGSAQGRFTRAIAQRNVAAALTIVESQLALASLAALCAGDRAAAAGLQALLRRIKPTALRRA